MQEHPTEEPEASLHSPEGDETGNGGEGEAGDPRAEIEKRDAEIRALSEKVLRAHAELDNYKKRVTKERTEWIRYSHEGLLRGLLEVLDNLERARVYGGKSAEAAQWAEGVSLTIKHFEDILTKAGVRPIKALGEKFDPSVHQAMAQVEAEGEAGRVVDEHQKGYYLHDRVLRPSMVTVSRKKGTGEQKES